MAAGGAALGILAAFWASKALGPVIPEDWYRVGEASIDLNVLLFTLAVTIGAVLVFGLAPALGATRTDLAAALKEGGRAGWSAGAMRVRRGLVVFQVVMAVVLISGMGLMVRSLVAARSTALGFRPDDVLVVEASPPESDYPTWENVRAYLDRVTREVERLPGVRRVANAAFLPLNNETSTTQLARPGREPARSEDWPLAVANRVSAGYFDAMAIPVMAGRDFGPEDGPDAPTVVVVSRSVAERHWPGERPLGRTILIGEPGDTRAAIIVGVVGEVRHQGIAVATEPMVYFAASQGGGRRRFVIVRGERDPAALASPVRQAMHLIDASLPLTVRPLSNIVNENLLPWSLPSRVLTVLGAVALLLASLGIYGLVAYSVAQRRREIGVRMALGATRERIRRGFLEEGLRLSVIGLVIGIVAALVTGRLMASRLFDVGPFDAVTLGAVLVVFAGVAVGASLLPAARASRVEPVSVLREL